MRTSSAVAMLSLLLSACDAAAPVDPSLAPRDPAVRGPWQVGVTEMQAIDPRDGTREITIEVWYPAVHAADAETDVVLGIATWSVRDAPADLRGGPFPVIGFSHGNAGFRSQSVYLTQQLASHGYVVVAPDHRYNTFFDDDEARLGEVLRNRPRDVRIAIDALLARAADPADPLAGVGDPARLGVSGHSFGGFTALLVGGATMDLVALRESCLSAPDDLACQKLDDGSLTEEIVGGFADPRIAATLALAPGGRLAFGPSGLASLGGAVLVQGGSLDTLTPLQTEIDPIYLGLPAPKLLAEFAGAAHFSFTDICPLYVETGGASGPLDFLATEGCGENTSPIEQVHADSATLAVAFFDLWLKGVADDAGYLDPARGPSAGVTLR